MTPDTKSPPPPNIQSNKNMRFGRPPVCAMPKLFAQLKSFCCGAMSLRPRSRTPRLVAVELGRGGVEVLRWPTAHFLAEEHALEWADWVLGPSPTLPRGPPDGGSAMDDPHGEDLLAFISCSYRWGQ